MVVRLLGENLGALEDSYFDTNTLPFSVNVCGMT